jgi:hypothetical protein
VPALPGPPGRAAADEDRGPDAVAIAAVWPLPPSAVTAAVEGRTPVPPSTAMAVTLTEVPSAASRP